MNPSETLNSIFGLTGRVAIVIGGTGESCGAMAVGLAGAGTEVVLVGRNAEKGVARLAAISAAGGRGWFHAADATNKTELETLRDTVLRHCGRIDIVVNGAGISSATPFFEITEKEFDHIVNVNRKSVMLNWQVSGQLLVGAERGGSIINLGSLSGVVPLSQVFTYSATRDAVHNLSLNLAREWAPHRVRVNVLVIVLTTTEIFTSLELGADVVKIFPTEYFGTGYLKSIKAPFPDIPIMPTGGVTRETAGEFLRKEAFTATAGRSLASAVAFKERNWFALTSRAQQFVAAANAA